MLLNLGEQLTFLTAKGAHLAWASVGRASGLVTESQDSASDHIGVPLANFYLLGARTVPVL